MSRSTLGTLCLRTWSTPGTLYLNAHGTQGTQIELYEFLEHSHTQINTTWSDTGPQTKTTQCAPDNT